MTNIKIYLDQPNLQIKMIWQGSADTDGISLQ